MTICNVRSFTRVVDGEIQQVSAHSRGVGRGFTHGRSFCETPKRTQEQYDALRAKFASHRLPRN